MEDRPLPPKGGRMSLLLSSASNNGSFRRRSADNGNMISPVALDDSGSNRMRGLPPKAESFRIGGRRMTTIDNSQRRISFDDQLALQRSELDWFVYVFI